MTTITPTNYTSPTRSRNQTIGDLPAALKSEWIKLSTVRSNKMIAAFTIGIGGVASFAVAKLVTDEVLYTSEVFIFSSVLTSMIAAVAGILIFTSEVQHGTLAPTITAQPNRSLVATSKMMMAAGLGAGLGVAGMAAGFVGAQLGGLEIGDTSGMATTALWAILYTSLAAVLGLGVGMITRHSSAAISGLLIWALVIENLVFVFAPQKVWRFMPFLAGDEMIGLEAPDETAEYISIAFTKAEGALVFGSYVAITMIVGTILFTRRDTN